MNFHYELYGYFILNNLKFYMNLAYVLVYDCFFRFFSSKNRRHSLRTSILCGFMRRLRLALVGRTRAFRPLQSSKSMTYLSTVN